MGFRVPSKSNYLQKIGDCHRYNPDIRVDGNDIWQRICHKVCWKYDCQFTRGSKNPGRQVAMAPRKVIVVQQIFGSIY